jgi:hypothetical protein
VFLLLSLLFISDRRIIITTITIDNSNYCCCQITIIIFHFLFLLNSIEHNVSVITDAIFSGNRWSAFFIFFPLLSYLFVVRQEFLSPICPMNRRTSTAITFSPNRWNARLVNRSTRYLGLLLDNYSNNKDNIMVTTSSRFQLGSWIRFWHRWHTSCRIQHGLTTSRSKVYRHAQWTSSRVRRSSNRLSHSYAWSMSSRVRPRVTSRYRRDGKRSNKLLVRVAQC